LFVRFFRRRRRRMEKIRRKKRNKMKKMIMTTRSRQTAFLCLQLFNLLSTVLGEKLPSIARNISQLCLYQM
jgi:hypothetical protein